MFRALAAAAVILVSGVAHAGITGESCVSRDAARQILAAQGQEIVAAADAGGSVISVAANRETGEWTLMFTNNDRPDVVCVAALGRDWVTIDDAPVPGKDA